MTDLFGKKSPKKKSKPRRKGEQKLQTRISDYINAKYNLQDVKVIFFCDVAAGLWLPPYMASLVARWRSCKSLPDLYILKASGEYHGLMLELKTEDAEIYKKDGSLKKNDHLESQDAIHKQLTSEGYCIGFTVGYTHATKVVDWYLSGAKGVMPSYHHVKNNFPDMNLFS
jgi:hypothetical protein